MAARPGNFCSPVGGVGATVAGTPMVCSVGDSSGRARWRADGDQADRKRARRALLAEAKRAGVKVPRGLADDKVRDLIAGTATPQSTRKPVAAPVSLTDQIGATVERLATYPGDLVSLAQLRKELPGVPRVELDRTLLTLNRSRTFQLDPDPNRRVMTDEYRAAAISVGGEDMHLISRVRTSR